MDLRPGGASNITMSSPDGQDMPCPGQYLEVVPNRKLVFTDAFTGDWVPKDGAPFMVATVTFEPEGGQDPLHRHGAALERGGPRQT